MKMDNLDRCNEIMQCVGRLWNVCDVDYDCIGDDLHTILDNIKRIKAELLELWNRLNILDALDLIDRDALLQDMTNRSDGISDWHVFDVINEQPTIEAEPVRHGAKMDGGTEDDQA